VARKTATCSLSSKPIASIAATMPSNLVGGLQPHNRIKNYMNNHLHMQ
jgi:hypothetical protein